jgi:hypothetical protein
MWRINGCQNGCLWVPKLCQMNVFGNQIEDTKLRFIFLSLGSLFATRWEAPVGPCGTPFGGQDILEQGFREDPSSCFLALYLQDFVTFSSRRFGTFSNWRFGTCSNRCFGTCPNKISRTFFNKSFGIFSNKRLGTIPNKKFGTFSSDIWKFKNLNPSFQSVPPTQKSTNHNIHVFFC